MFYKKLSYIKEVKQFLFYAEMIDRINAIVEMIEQRQRLSVKHKGKEEEKEG